MALKSVKQKLDEWLYKGNNFPLGCETQAGCQFNGTATSFKEYRQQWINNCSSSVSTGLLQSKKNALGQCQAVFDDKTYNINLKNYDQNAKDLQATKEKNEELSKQIGIAFLLVVLVAVIVWLLTSK